MPFDFAFGLREVGSKHTVVRAEVVEAEAPDSLSLALGEAEELRKGRNLRVEQPTSKALHRDMRAGDTARSLGQRFDRMIETTPYESSSPPSRSTRGATPTFL